MDLAHSPVPRLSPGASRAVGQGLVGLVLAGGMAALFGWQVYLVLR